MSCTAGDASGGTTGSQPLPATGNVARRRARLLSWSEESAARRWRLVHVSRAGYYRWQEVAPRVDPELDLSDESNGSRWILPANGWA